MRHVKHFSEDQLATKILSNRASMMGNVQPIQVEKSLVHSADTRNACRLGWPRKVICFITSIIVLQYSYSMRYKTLYYSFQ